MLTSAQNTSTYASMRTRGGTPIVRIHANVCGIWFTQRDVLRRSTAAWNVASSGAKEGYAPCGWMRRGVEGVCEGGSSTGRKSSPGALSMPSNRALWAVVARKRLRLWGGARKLLRSRSGAVADFSPEQRLACAGGRTSASASHPVSSTLLKILCA